MPHTDTEKSPPPYAHRTKIEVNGKKNEDAPEIVEHDSYYLKVKKGENLYEFFRCDQYGSLEKKDHPGLRGPGLFGM